MAVLFGAIGGRDEEWSRPDSRAPKSATIQVERLLLYQGLQKGDGPRRSSIPNTVWSMRRVLHSIGLPQAKTVELHFIARPCCLARESMTRAG
jgi:hypothetical protein